MIATNVALYTFYEHTHLHPRFLYVTLPALFALEAAGAWLVIRKVSETGPERGYDRPQCLLRSSPAVPVFSALISVTRCSSVGIVWSVSTTWRRARSANIEHMRTAEFAFVPA